MHSDSDLKVLEDLKRPCIHRYGTGSRISSRHFCIFPTLTIFAWSFTASIIFDCFARNCKTIKENCFSHNPPQWAKTRGLKSFNSGWAGVYASAKSVFFFCKFFSFTCLIIKKNRNNNLINSTCKNIYAFKRKIKILELNFFFFFFCKFFVFLLPIILAVILSCLIPCTPQKYTLKQPPPPNSCNKEWPPATCDFTNYVCFCPNTFHFCPFSIIFHNLAVCQTFKQSFTGNQCIVNHSQSVFRSLRRWGPGVGQRFCPNKNFEQKFRYFLCLFYIFKMSCQPNLRKLTC